jgi:YD repeat-containing protein
MTWDGSGAYVSAGANENLESDLANGKLPTSPEAVLYDQAAGQALAGGNGTDWVLAVFAGTGKVDVIKLTLNNTGNFSYDGNVITGNNDFNSSSPTLYWFDTTTTYQYNAQGQQSEVIDPLGNVTSYEYDSLGRLIQTGYTPVNGVATTSSETYDSAGNKASETDQLGRTTDYKYDNAGDLIEVDQLLGWIWIACGGAFTKKMPGSDSFRSNISDSTGKNCSRPTFRPLLPMMSVEKWGEIGCRNSSTDTPATCVRCCGKNSICINCTVARILCIPCRAKYSEPSMSIMTTSNTSPASR